MRRAAIVIAALLVACASGPVPPAWQADAKGAIERATAAYLAGETRLHDTELARARAAVASTGRTELAARIELLDCAAHVASLVFEPCTRFDALRPDAGAAERAYADYLAGKPLAREAIALLPATQQSVATAVAANATAPAAVPATEDPQSRLIATAVLFRAGLASPALIDAAAETASTQGWRRPLLAWLKVQALRAEKAGDAAEAQRLQRRIALVENALR